MGGQTNTKLTPPHGGCQAAVSSDVHVNASHWSAQRRIFVWLPGTMNLSLLGQYGLLSGITCASSRSLSGPEGNSVCPSLSPLPPHRGGAKCREPEACAGSTGSCGRTFHSTAAPFAPGSRLRPLPTLGSSANRATRFASGRRAVSALVLTNTGDHVTMSSWCLLSVPFAFASQVALRRPLRLVPRLLSGPCGAAAWPAPLLPGSGVPSLRFRARGGRRASPLLLAAATSTLLSPSAHAVIYLSLLCRHFSSSFRWRCVASARQQPR